MPSISRQLTERPHWLRRMPITRARILVVGLCLSLMAIDDVHIVLERATLLANAQGENDMFAASMALQATHVIPTTNALLASLVEDLDALNTDHGQALHDVERLFSERQATLGCSQFSGFYSPTGQRMLGGNGAPAQMNISAAADPLVHIGAPVQIGAGGSWVIPFTRQVAANDRHAAGIAVIAVDIDRLLDVANLPALPKKATIAAFGPDGSQLLSRARTLLPVMDAADAGAIEQTTPGDGLTRLVSYRRVFNGNLLLEVGRDRASVLAAWWPSALLQLGGVGILVGLVIWLGFIMESQERRRQATELRAARRSAKRTMLAEFGSDILVEFDAQFCIRYVEARLKDIYGYAPQAVIGSSMLDAMRPVDGVAIALALEAAARGEARPAFVAHAHHADGQPIWLEIVLRQVEDLGDGTVILGVIRDVTAQQKAELREAAMLADLQNAHSTLLRAQRVAHEGHWRLDAETHSMLCSGEVSRIFGLADDTPKPATQSALQGLLTPLASDERITLETMFARIHADERSLVEKEMRRALIEGSAFHSNFRVVQPDGSIRFVSCFAGPDQDSEGNTAGLIGTVQDVTERATQEQEQHHENKIRTIGRLASGVAHDFNNLLQSITSCLELIGDQLAQNGVTSDYVRIALEASERGSYLTHHLLSYARKQILKPKRVLPEAMLRDMQVLLERTLGPHIKVQTQVSGHIPAIEVDPTHLQTALLNLGINSGHAMANGGTLTLEARIEDGPTPIVVMAVVDTGIGMDAATLAQATDPFFTTKGVMGTGLGLSMVNGFAQQSGGEMRISSRIGEGTRIELRLPAVLAREAAPAAAAAIGDVRGHRILLVEDASDVRITTSAFLVARSMSTVAVASGEEAIDQLTRGESFDVMITDYAMPGIDGVETIRRARLLQHGLPAIIITGFANLEDVKTLPSDVQVLRKPFHRLDLLDAVTRAITHHSVAALATSADTAQATPAAPGSATALGPAT